MNRDASGRFDMSNFNIENVTSLEKAIQVIETYFLNPFTAYINSDFDGARFNSNPKNYTMSYMYLLTLIFAYYLVLGCSSRSATNWTKPRNSTSTSERL